MAQCLVDFSHDWADGFRQFVTRSGDGLDLVADALHCSPTRPALQIASPAVLPGFHLAAMKPEEIEALTSITDVDHLGFGRMERQLQAAQDDPDPPERFARLRLRPARQDGVISLTDQLPQLAAAVLPEP